MPNHFFQFKQFTVWQDKCAMKVGTDGVLLGAWAAVSATNEATNAPSATTQNIAVHNAAIHNAAVPSETVPSSNNDSTLRILDVGTGTGLIALMIAQRNSRAKIDAIDIDESACIQATENIEKSPFKDRIRVIYQSFTDYVSEKKYDLIVSNPPYFTQSLKCPDEKRSMARHNDSLPLKRLIEQTIALLSENGRIALILPTQLSEELDFIIATHKLYAVRRTDVIPVAGAPSKRFLIELAAKMQEGQIQTDTLTLETKDRKRTEQYQKFAHDFYL